MAFYSQELGYYATSFECEKGLFRAQLGLWPASPRRLSSDLVSNRLGSRSISGWEADQFHKCAIWQARGFCTPQPRICAPGTKMLRVHVRALSGCNAPCNFLAILYSFDPFCCAVELTLCHEWLFFCVDDAEFLSPCADEISVITDMFHVSPLTQMKLPNTQISYYLNNQVGLISYKNSFVNKKWVWTNSITFSG